MCTTCTMYPKKEPMVLLCVLMISWLSPSVGGPGQCRGGPRQLLPQWDGKQTPALPQHSPDQLLRPPVSHREASPPVPVWRLPAELWTGRQGKGWQVNDSHAYIHVHAYIHAYINTYMYIPAYIQPSICAYVQVYIHLYIHVYKDLYLYVFIRVYIPYICTQTHNILFNIILI